MSATTPLHVVIVDDAELIVAGIAKMLSRYPVTVTSAQLTTSRTQLLADVGIVLYDTGGRSPADDLALGRLIGRTSAKVVVYTWEAGRDDTARAESLGAVGWLSKKMDAEQLWSALQGVETGSRAVDPFAPSPSRFSKRGAARAPAPPLTRREAEVLMMISKGFSNNEIAEHLFLSVNTIKTNIRSAYSKIGAERRSQAVSWALRNDLLDPAAALAPRLPA